MLKSDFSLLKSCFVTDYVYFVFFLCENVLILQVIVNVLLKRNPFAVPGCNKKIIRVWGIERMLQSEKLGIFFEKTLFLFKIDLKISIKLPKIYNNNPKNIMD